MMFPSADATDQPGLMPEYYPAAPVTKKLSRQEIAERDWTDELARREAKLMYLRPFRDRVRKRPADHRLKLRTFTRRMLDPNPRDGREMG